MTLLVKMCSSLLLENVSVLQWIISRCYHAHHGHVMHKLYNIGSESTQFIIIINLDMTMTVKLRCPAVTAEPIATLSAQTHRGNDAFSMLQPAHDALMSQWCHDLGMKHAVENFSPKTKQNIHRHQTPSRYRHAPLIASRFSIHVSAPRPLRPNVTSSIKPEIHSVSLCRQRRTEPRPQGICAQNFVTIGPAVPAICSRTDRRTNRQTDCNTPLPYRGGIIKLYNAPQFSRLECYPPGLYRPYPITYCSYMCNIKRLNGAR